MSKWRLWFARGDSALPWRLQHVDDLGKDDQVIKASEVDIQYARTEYVPDRTTAHPPNGTLICYGKVFLQGTKAVVS